MAAANKRNVAGMEQTTTNQQCQRLLKKKELAAVLNCSTRWIELAHHRGLPRTYIGTHNRYDLDEVKAWRAAQQS